MFSNYQIDLIKAWLNSDNVTDNLKDQIKKMDKETAVIAFSDKRLKFGTAGYRAIMGPGNHFLNYITYQQLAFAYADYLINNVLNENSSKTIIILSDNRRNYKLHVESIAAVMQQKGFDVIVSENFEPLPTPFLSYLIRKYNAIGGINITASHNPKEYNGIKFFNANGSQLLPEEDEKLISLIPDSIQFLDLKFKLDSTQLKYISPSLKQNYFDDIKSFLNLTENTNFKKKILFSGMHGTSCKMMPEFLKGLGYDVVDYTLHNFVDEDFINANHINPESIDTFKDLISFADNLNIEIILATDPDADRLGFCYKRNNEWILLDGNRSGIIQTNYLLSKFNNNELTPVVVSTFVSNNYIDLIAKHYNAIVIRTATGFKWIANVIDNLESNQKFIIGFEEAIGALDSDLNREKDSFQTAGLLLQILREYQDNNYDFTDILEKEIFPKYGYWYGCTISKVIEGNNWRETANTLMSNLKSYHYENIVSRKIVSIKYNELGSCLDFNLENNSWIKFRISGTEPKFKIYFNLYIDENEHKNDSKDNYTNLLKEEVSDILDYINQYLGI